MRKAATLLRLVRFQYATPDFDGDWPIGTGSGL